MATSAANIFNRLIQKRNVDILCLQETKLQEQHVAELDRYLRSVLDIHSIYWSCSTIKKGYSGTAIILLNTKYNQEIYNSINAEVIMRTIHLLMLIIAIILKNQITDTLMHKL